MSRPPRSSAACTHASTSPAPAPRPPLYLLGLAPVDGVTWAESQTFRRLLEWSQAAELRDVPLVNVWRWPWQVALGRRACVERGRAGDVGQLLSGARALVLGARLAWLVWGVRCAQWASLKVAGAELLVIPHPSGRNRDYNAPEARERAGAAVRQLLRDRA